MRSPLVSVLFMMLMGLCCLKTNATNRVCKNYILIVIDSITQQKDTILQSSEIDLPDYQTLIVKDSTQKKKIVSALFALPFPFGFMGAHRIMLGCKPWIPVVYVATFGGCFGLLPLIDFFVISFSRDISQYENNPRIFMWIK